MSAAHAQVLELCRACGLSLINIGWKKGMERGWGKKEREDGEEKRGGRQEGGRQANFSHEVTVGPVSQDSYHLLTTQKCF